MKTSTALLVLLALVSVAGLPAQTPKPIIVQAANVPAGTITSSPPPAPAPDNSTVLNAIKALEQIKAANAETLKRQEETLQKLDELQKAAEQLKFFTKRG